MSTSSATVQIDRAYHRRNMDFDRMERIDAHAHAITPRYRQYLIQTGHEHPDGWPELPQWSPEQHIAMMEANNITRTILSISTPGTCLIPFDDALNQEVTRSTNAELSSVCAAHPDQFRFVASLPLPNVEDALEEIDYALDTLGAVGFSLLSNSNGVYLGDAVLDPVFERLNERRAIVFIHPTSTKIVSRAQGNLTDNHIRFQTDMKVVTPTPQIPSGLLEYMFDETRAVANLLVSGTVTRYPNIKFIMSHAGCLLPPILERIVVALQNFFGGTMTSAEMRNLLATRFHFDLAGLPWPDMVHGLLRIVGPDRLLYGSDYCWTPLELTKKMRQTMDEEATELWDEQIIRGVYAGNAKKLFGL